MKSRLSEKYDRLYVYKGAGNIWGIVARYCGLEICQLLSLLAIIFLHNLNALTTITQYLDSDIDIITKIKVTFTLDEGGESDVAAVA